MRSVSLRLLAPLLLAFVACEELAVAPPADGGVDASAAGGTSAGGGGGAGGTAIECLLPIDCPGEDTACRTRTCVAFTCGFQAAPAGTVTPAQLGGDCSTRVCDGAGNVTYVADPLDTLDDHNPCTKDLCTANLPRHEAWISAACGVEGEGFCDGHGDCAECVIPEQCGLDEHCVNNRCVPARCLDGVKDGDETAVDCGGSACGPCGAGKPCYRDRDCASALCDPDTKLCAAATCGDGRRNGGETDVDCGGPCALLCAAGKACKADGDCLGGSCSGSMCLPSCADGVRNGGETGLDCGGPRCSPCPLGASCDSGGDCLSGVCQTGRCVVPSCVDGAPSAGETDLDCGGSCAPCKPGKTCVTGDDCTSSVCAGTLCATPSCSDHMKNGAETGTDCGGPGCGKCPDGQSCLLHEDCASGVCFAGACVAPGCADGITDLGETDVDCGGSTCAPCGPTRACNSDPDCASKKCVAGKCASSKCNDGIANGDETDLDCGGSCVPCKLDDGCKLHEDCETIACAADKCVQPTCFDGVRNGDETGKDCGGPLCGKCAGGQGCTTDGDCASLVCNADVCASSCTDGVQDGDETGVDCGGSCDGCQPGGPCELDADCDSDVCVGGTCLAPTCQDTVKNGAESDADCGGGACPQCAAGKKCQVDGDCKTLGCRSGLCEEVLLISEVRTNGPHAGLLDDEFADEIVELYNPGNADIVMDASWLFYHRSAQGACQGKFLRYKGTGLVIPSHGHLLLTGLAYAGPPGDAPLLSTPGNSIADAASLWIEHSGKVIDALCYFYDDVTLARLNGTGGCVPDYICEGPPISNLPHNGNKSPMSSVDVSLERKPGGALGNGQDTGDSTADFQTITPAIPQSLSSPPTP